MVQSMQRPLGVIENDNVFDPTPTPCNHLHVLTITTTIELVPSICVISNGVIADAVDLSHKCQNNMKQE